VGETGAMLESEQLQNYNHYYQSIGNKPDKDKYRIQRKCFNCRCMAMDPDGWSKDLGAFENILSFL
jgi:hypothetical protein